MRENQQIQQLFIQFINYVCSSYMFRHYIAIFRERSKCLLRDAQLRSSRWQIVDGPVVSSDVVRGDLRSLRMLPEDGNVMPKHVGATIRN
jgi:hypothetical protein